MHHFLVSHVIFLADSPHLSEPSQKHLTPKRKVKDPNHSRPFLGIELDWTTPGFVWMKRSNFILRLFSKTGMLNRKPTGSAVDTLLTYDETIKSEPLSPENRSVHWSMTISLLYLLLKTRPELCAVGSMLGWNVAQPCRLYMLVAKQILRYLKNTAHYSFKLHPGQQINCLHSSTAAGSWYRTGAQKSHGLHD